MDDNKSFFSEPMKIRHEEKIVIAIEVFDLMVPRIKKVLLNTRYQNREDLEQEIKLKLLEAIFSNKIAKPPDFWSFYKEKKYKHE